MKKHIAFLLTLISAIGLSWIAAAKSPQAESTSSVYAGHGKNGDIQSFLRQYPKAAGTRLDDCQTCHRGGVEGTDTEREFNPCGYCTIEDINNPFPKGYFYAAPGTIKEKERVFVQYPKSIPPGVLDGKEIPDTPWLLLAFERDGKPLSGSYYEKETGKIGGEGPYRLVRPQRTVMVDPAKPGRPDRSDKDKQYGDGWDFLKEINHNAGACVRGASVIRINPMPKGFEEHNWKNSWPLVDRRQIVVFGHGVTHK